jgi:hypothetical protein
MKLVAVAVSLFATACAAVAPLSVRVTPIQPSAPMPCAAPIVAPALGDSRFAPAISGELSLVRAEGDERLSAEDGGILTAWSRDSALVTFSDHGAVTTWQTRDGKLVDLIRCAPGDMGTNEIELSGDGRWIVVSGVLRDPKDTWVTCIADRSSGRARLLPGETRGLVFEGDGRTVRGDGRAIDLETGAERPAGPSSSPYAGAGLEGGSSVSHDGRYVASWPGCGPFELYAAQSLRSSPPAHAQADARRLLVMGESATGKVLWRVPTDGCTPWRFSPGDRFLEKLPNFYGQQIYNARTGERLDFPGGLLQIAPDDAHVVVLGHVGPELWSLDPRAPVVAGLRHRAVAARSRDGSVVAAFDRERLVLERAGRCIPLDLPFDGAVTRFDPLTFTPDGTQLYAGLRLSKAPGEPRMVHRHRPGAQQSLRFWGRRRLSDGERRSRGVRRRRRCADLRRDPGGPLGGRSRPAHSVHPGQRGRKILAGARSGRGSTRPAGVRCRNRRRPTPRRHYRPRPPDRDGVGLG